MFRLYYSSTLLLCCVSPGVIRYIDFSNAGEEGKGGVNGTRVRG